MVEKAEDIVERLRKEATGVTVNLNPWPTMREAADELERLRGGNSATGSHEARA